MMVDTRWATMTHGGVGDDRRERGAEPGVGGEVERRERVVEQVDAGLAHQRPGDGQPLALPTRHVGAALGDAGVEAAGHGGHEVAGLRDLERVPRARRRWRPRSA